MHVEDHPVEYGDFEGVIPEGYGAGLVMLWDRGTWTPEATDVDQALRKGDLKFTLDGYKLKGSWVLVRTKGGDGRSWLLIKHRDDWSGDLDIAEFAPLSVKSGGAFEDILAADNPAVWHSNRPAKGGETGAMFADIIERAARIKAERARATSPKSVAATKKTSPSKAAAPKRKKSSTTKSAAAKKSRR
jgi:bifunctional non-homologous end joining protein LigD